MDEGQAGGIVFLSAKDVGCELHPQMSRVFVEGFYDWIKHFCKDKQKLTDAFTHVFDMKYFYVAMDGEKVAAMVACTQGNSPITLDRKVFTKQLGLIRGNFAYYMLNRHMVRNSYPFALSRTTGSIEFVATAPEYRNRGIAGGLITHAMSSSPYDSHILEVADTNKGAVHLYSKLGFKEIKRVPAPNPKRTGVDFFLYMRCDGEAK